MVFGVRKPLANLNPFWANLQVYDYLLFDARKTRRWVDKLAVWFRRTGWRPADVEARYPKKRTDLGQFQKYDPRTPRVLKHYVMMQFIVGIIGALVVAELYLRHGAAAVLIPCVLLWLQLYTIGLLNDGRAYARRVELLRLLVGVPLLLMLLSASIPGFDHHVAAWAVAAVYLAVSVLWLLRVPASEAFSIKAF